VPLARDGLYGARPCGLQQRADRGGDFTTAGEQPANRIARWDGSACSRWVGDGRRWISVGASVLALTVYNGELIAGAVSRPRGGVECNYIARWTLGVRPGQRDGTRLFFSPTWGALAVYNNELIAGAVSRRGGVECNYIARWNGLGLGAPSAPGMGGCR